MKFKGVIQLIMGVAIVLWVAQFAYARETAEHHQAINGLTKGETGRVLRIIDGDSFILEGGLRVNLAAVQAPKRSWPEKGLMAWPLAERSRFELADILEGKRVQLYYGGVKRDRYERAPAQVWLISDDGSENFWVQEAMVETGMARVYTWPGQIQNTGRLYKAEQIARKEGHGIWDHDETDGFYDVRRPDPDPLVQYVDSVQIVEGIVISSADVRGITFLNFGSDYKTDFTVAIAKKDRKAFKKTGVDLLGLEGARVRARGWIELGNGPVIWLKDPNRLEVLD